MAFKWDIKKESDSICEIVPIGHFDEDVQVPEDVPYGELKILKINLGRMDSLNSRGIKTWILFIDKLSQYPNLNVKLENCPRIFVDQVNLIDGMVSEQVAINSLLIPIFCNKCEDTLDVFQTVEDIKIVLADDINYLIDKVKLTSCDSFPNCKREFEIDVMPDLYFKFLKEK